jgi:hypothetical protein
MMPRALRWYALRLGQFWMFGSSLLRRPVSATICVLGANEAVDADDLLARHRLEIGAQHLRHTRGVPARARAEGTSSAG